MSRPFIKIEDLDDSLLQIPGPAASPLPHKCSYSSSVHSMPETLACAGGADLHEAVERRTSSPASVGSVRSCQLPCCRRTPPAVGAFDSLKVPLPSSRCSTRPSSPTSLASSSPTDLSAEAEAFERSIADGDVGAMRRLLRRNRKSLDQSVSLDRDSLDDGGSSRAGLSVVTDVGDLAPAPLSPSLSAYYRGGPRSSTGGSERTSFSTSGGPHDIAPISEYAEIGESLALLPPAPVPSYAAQTAGLTFRVALHLAVQHNAVEALHALLRFGFDPCRPGPSCGQRNVHAELRKALLRSDNLRALLQSEQKRPAAVDNLSLHDILAGANKGLTRPQRLALLRDVSAQLLKEDFFFSLPPLLYACYLGRKEIARLLLRHGASVGCVDHLNNGPLHLLGLAKARKEDIALVRLLLAYGAAFARPNCLWLTAEDLRPSVRAEAFALVQQACQQSFPLSARKTGSEKNRHKERRRKQKRGAKGEHLVKSESSTFSCDLERTSSTVSNRASREKEVSPRFSGCSEQ